MDSEQRPSYAHGYGTRGTVQSDEQVHNFFALYFYLELTLLRKLSILHPPQELPLILSLSDYTDMKPNPQAENFFSVDFQGHLLTFLSYLAFWQDVLEHCRSVDVRVTLIDHFQALFLQQLL